MKSIVGLGRFLLAILLNKDAVLKINGSSITFHKNGDLSIKSPNSIFIQPDEYLLLGTGENQEALRENMPALKYQRDEYLASKY